MKVAMTVVLLLGASALAQAQDTMEQKRDKKLASGFLKKAPWITDYDKALEESKKSGKAIFAYFTRSYAP
jgi:hypothetical protein